MTHSEKISATLYVHFPFCRKKCGYCDFFSSAGAHADYEAYAEAVISEWRLRRNELNSLPETVYFGGGTPSMIPRHILQRIVDEFGRYFNPHRLAEFTIEANPEDITADTLDAFRSMGINRVSIGVQSFNSDLLAAISRQHSAEEALRALELLSSGKWNYSADLIYGLPGQTVADMEKDLEQLLHFRPPHFSAYLLSYEPGTPLYIKRQKGVVSESPEEWYHQMYSILCDKASAAGYNHYEISNFALPGREAVHNSAYWNYTPYLGLGPGAHSLGADGIRRFNTPGISKYISTLKEGKSYFTVDEETSANRANDLIITALRTSSGLNPELLPSEFRTEFQDNAALQLHLGNLEKTPEGLLIIPESLWLTADSILRELIVG